MRPMLLAALLLGACGSNNRDSADAGSQATQSEIVTAGQQSGDANSSSTTLSTADGAVGENSSAVGLSTEQQQQQKSGRPVALITGSTDGLGRELALRVAAMGVHVIVHGRNRERGMEVVDAIKKEGKGSAEFIAADLASLAQVRILADSVLKGHSRLDYLINNAGIWLRNATSRELSVDGYELTFAVNYLSGFLLTHLLKERLMQSAPARVVNVASRTQTALDLSDVNMERNFSGQRGYGQSKLAQVMFTFDLAEELRGKGVTVNAVHPASQMDTEMVRGVGAVPRSTVAEGADAVMQLITTPNLGTGLWFVEMVQGQAMAQAYDVAARKQLHDISMKLTGLSKEGSPRHP